jgi:hypothetical protein
MLEHAITYEHYEFVEWCIHTIPAATLQQSYCIYAYANKHLPTLKLLKSAGAPLNKRIYIGCHISNLEILKWALQNEFQLDMLNGLSTLKNPECMDYLLSIEMIFDEDIRKWTCNFIINKHSFELFKILVKYDRWIDSSMLQEIVRLKLTRFIRYVCSTTSNCRALIDNELLAYALSVGSLGAARIIRAHLK